MNTMSSQEQNNKMSDVVMNDVLKKNKWGDLELRDYQLEGVAWLLNCYKNGHGCILSDEMGLGKTCQTIAMLTLIKGQSLSSKPHLVVCPRSVLENWQKEFHRFSPSLEVLMYIGDKEVRADMANNVKKARKKGKAVFDIFLTTYEICIKDHLFIGSVSWNVLVVDEGHRLKNRESLLYTTLDEWDIDLRILLTGTPLQNNMSELYSLLSLVDRATFKLSGADKFVKKFGGGDQDVKELHALLTPYLLRRTKADVLKDLPEKSEIVLYHGLSQLQKKIYKAILTKDLGVFETGPYASSTRLMNVLMQLRKCVNHPYIFDGVEPEPFVIGEHLVDASHKFVLLDRLLSSLHAGGHKVLLFSQMTRMLDVLQDYLAYRGYNYERLDGSVRGEERFLAVQNFNSNDETFVFLLSTRAGGQGLNLTSADTVIFLDSDFNPQNDLQAAARAHRIGQDRPVKIIRLVGTNTVEEIVFHRANLKLKLTEKVIESGQFAASTSTKQSILGSDNTQLQDILKFGVEELLSESSADAMVDFESVLGPSRDGQWVEKDGSQPDDNDMDTTESPTTDENDPSAPPQSMYMFEGTDFSKEPSAADLKAFQELIGAEKALAESKVHGERTLRRAGTSVTALLPLSERKPKKAMTPEELEERKKKREEAEAKRAKRAEEQKKLRALALKKKREQLWEDNGYTTCSVALDSEGEEEGDEDDNNATFSLNLDDDESDNENNDRGEESESSLGEASSSTPRRKAKRMKIRYVMGDVTHPLDAGTDDNIVVHCADNSGTWGAGGLFSALSARSPQAEKIYETAGLMKDLSLGDCHLIPIDDIESRENGRDLLALIIAQERDKRTQRLSGIKLANLDTGLRKVCQVALEKKASVHLPRLGQSTPAFNWYGTERLIQKRLAAMGVPTLIYYYPRRHQKRKHTGTANPNPTKVTAVGASPTSTTPTPASSSTTPSSSSSTSTNVASTQSLPTLFSGVSVYFHGVHETDVKRLKRFIIAYDGDVEKHCSPTVTHIISCEQADLQDLQADITERKVPVIGKEWIEDSISKRRIQSLGLYLV